MKDIKAAIVNLSDESEETRRKLASEPDTSERILRQLAEDKSMVVRTLVAKNPNTPDDVVEYLKAGQIIPPNAVEASYIYGAWDWNPSEWLDYVNTASGDSVLNHVVIFSDDDDFLDADWWVDTVAAVSALEDFLSIASDYDDFLNRVHEEYGDDYDNCDLRELFDLYESYGCTDYDFCTEAVGIINPELNIEEDRIFAPNRSDAAYVLYEPYEVNLSELSNWFFGDIYETREWYLDFNDIPEDSDIDFPSVYWDYGDDGNEYHYITNTDYENMDTETLKNYIRDLHGYSDPDECYVVV